ncbi:uncharacterized protein LOC130628737 [Hydractinia symbiolongicarpus]|uniref:uncharacterized protein LOC130628737 n=1 Tax=Hydractinia symbiolongicarpus TaxID=13093 RepID=UPI0025517F4F|nr:uncharacterized protein LOC130628737 [Hydractinia symbiolongicarpus]XP_057297714.1 uncharacterized protein LOC130628737 [Hydractinia symbiolongicarpus]
MAYFLIGCLVAMVIGTECAVTTFTFSGSQSANLHNEKRNLHINTPPLSGDYGLAIQARDCAKRILEENLDASTHPCNPEALNVGENIYVASAYGEPLLENAIKPWYAEVKDIDFSNDVWVFTADNTKVGHVTQMLWVASSAVGCGGAKKPINGYGKHTIVIICRYSPMGNRYQGDFLRNNVKPPKATATVTNCANQAFCVSYAVSHCTIGSFKDLVKSMCPKLCGLC